MSAAAEAGSCHRHQDLLQQARDGLATVWTAGVAVRTPWRHNGPPRCSSCCSINQSWATVGPACARRVGEKEKKPANVSRAVTDKGDNARSGRDGKSTVERGEKRNGVVWHTAVPIYENDRGTEKRTHSRMRKCKILTSLLAQTCKHYFMTIF